MHDHYKQQTFDNFFFDILTFDKITMNLNLCERLHNGTTHGNYVIFTHQSSKARRRKEHVINYSSSFWASHLCHSVQSIKI